MLRRESSALRSFRKRLLAGFPRVNIKEFSLTILRETNFRMVKILFSERKGIPPTDHKALKRRDKGVRL